MSGAGGWLHGHDGLVVLLQVGAFGLLLLASRRLLVESFVELGRPLQAGLFALSLLAALISAFWLPAFSAFEALGHEASYLECFSGAAMDGSGSVSPANAHGWEAFVTYPLIRWAWWLLGRLSGGQDVAWLLAFNIGLRALSVFLLGWTARVLAGRASCALVAALVLACHPWHAFWGAAIYNVALPFLFAVATLLLALLAWSRGGSRLLAAAAAAGTLVVAGRVEWAILAPMTLILLLGLGPSWPRADGVLRPSNWIFAALLAALGIASVVFAGGQLTEQGGYHGIEGYLETLLRQAWILDLNEPFHRPWTLLAPALGGLVMIRSPRFGWRAAGGLAAFFLVGYLAVSTFNDFSHRHVLPAGIGLVLLSSFVVLPLFEGGRSLRIVAACSLVLLIGTELVSLQRVASRYYLSQDEFFAEHEGFSGPQLEAAAVESGTCYLITDNERHWQQGIAGSHFNLMDPGEAVTHWRRFSGCVLWLFDNAGYRYDGLAVPPRSTKLLHWFEWDYKGWVRLAEGEVLVYQMRSAPWGIEDHMPVPETEFRLPGQEDPEDAPEQGPEAAPGETLREHSPAGQGAEPDAELGEAPSGVDSAR
ncbi:MAG: hypothetical protein CMP23_05210 [Rickettsiales bacterium]|nr:hypothetical protein [Rickettsiales bacterium]